MFSKEFLKNASSFLSNIYSRLASSREMHYYLQAHVSMDALRESISRFDQTIKFFADYWEEAEKNVNVNSISRFNEFIDNPNYLTLSYESTSYDPYLLLKQMKILIKKQIKVPFRYEGHHYRGFIDRALGNLRRIKNYQRNLKRFHQGYDKKVYNIFSFPSGVNGYLSKLLNNISFNYPQKMKEYNTVVKPSYNRGTDTITDFLCLLDSRRKVWTNLSIVLVGHSGSKPWQKLRDATKRKLYTYHRKMEALMDKLSKIKMHHLQLINIMLTQKANYSKLIARSSLSSETKKDSTKDFMDNIKIRLRRTVLILEVIKAFEENFKFPMDYNVIKYDQ